MSVNPYAQPAAGADAPAATPEEQLRLDYERAIGRNLEYYLPRFEQFDAGGSRIGWNWPAFVVTGPWLLYRKMFGLGILYLFYPIIAVMVLGLGAALLGLPDAVITVLALLLFIAPWILVPMFANALYWRRTRQTIERQGSVTRDPEKRAARITRNGGTAVGEMIAILLGFWLVGGGIIAGISIPAYQDYTIRSQVVEGLNLAGPVKAEVADFWEANGRWPSQADLESEPPSGKYVESIVVNAGSVIIVYGGEANSILQQQGLALVPGVDSSNQVHWVCGNAEAPEGVALAEGPAGSDLAPKYLPSACRERRGSP